MKVMHRVSKLECIARPEQLVTPPKMTKLHVLILSESDSNLLAIHLLKLEFFNDPFEMRQIGSILSNYIAKIIYLDFFELQIKKHFDEKNSLLKFISDH